MDFLYFDIITCHSEILQPTSVSDTAIFFFLSNLVSMIRKNYNHKLQTNPWKSWTTIKKHQEDKQSKATSSLFPIKMIAKLERILSDECTTKHRTITDSHNGSNNKPGINNNRTTALERTAA